MRVCELDLLLECLVQRQDNNEQTVLVLNYQLDMIRNEQDFHSYKLFSIATLLSFYSWNFLYTCNCKTCIKIQDL